MGPFHVKHPGSVYTNLLSPPLGRHLARLELARERAGPLDSVATAMLIPTRRAPKPTLRTDDGSLFHVKHRAGLRVRTIRRFASHPHRDCWEGGLPVRHHRRQFQDAPVGRPSLRPAARRSKSHRRAIAARRLDCGPHLWVTKPVHHEARLSLRGTGVQNGVDRGPPIRLP